MSFDFFEVLDSVTIARSRKHIEQYYDTADIGKFPTRLNPISKRPDLTSLDSAINYNEIYDIVSRLNLAIYTPSDFILPSRLDKYYDTESDGGYFAGRIHYSHHVNPFDNNDKNHFTSENTNRYSEGLRL